MKISYSLLLLPLFFIASCGSISPEAPEIIVQETYVAPPLEMSTIKVPIKINLKPYFDETDKSIDTKFSGKEEQCSGVSIQYNFVRNPIEFKGVGDKLHFDVDGKYAITLNYCPTCSDLFASSPYCLTPRIYASCGVGEPMRKIHVGYETTIGITKNYSLKSTTKLRKVEALSPCKITVFEYDATSKLEKEVTKILSDMEKDIDKEISAVSIKSEIEKTWNLLHAPTDLAGYGFLELNPKAISIGKIKYTGNYAEFDVILEAKPKILSAVSETKPKALPPVSTFKDREGFDIHTDIYSNYDSLSSVLTRTLSGTKLDLKGKEVIFGDIAIYGASNEQISIQLSFSGSKKGTLFLVGTPKFDKEKQHISFPDLEFDVKTKSALLKSAKWLFDKKVTNLLRESAAIDLTPYLASLKTTMNESLNVQLDKGVSMSGKVKDVKIDLIHPLSEQLHIRVLSTGSIAIDLN